MHSSHYSSMTIHHHGDLEGEYVIVELRRDKEGNQLIPDGKTWEDIPEIRISSRKFDSICKKMVVERSFNRKKDFDFSLKDNLTDKKTIIKVNSGEMVDFYLYKMLRAEINKLEKMSFNQLVKRYSNEL